MTDRMRFIGSNIVDVGISVARPVEQGSRPWLLCGFRWLRGTAHVDHECIVPTNHPDHGTVNGQPHVCSCGETTLQSTAGNTTYDLTHLHRGELVVLKRTLGAYVDGPVSSPQEPTLTFIFTGPCECGSSKFTFKDGGTLACSECGRAVGTWTGKRVFSGGA